MRNFLPDRICGLTLSHAVVPVVNQIELHPFLDVPSVNEVCRLHGIQFEQ